MRQSVHQAFTLAVVTVVSVALFCGGCSSSTTSHAASRTAGQYFKEQQSATMTPNGKIMVDTVTEKNDKIEYETQDGKKWRVTYSKQADGTYQYGTPDELK